MGSLVWRTYSADCWLPTADTGMVWLFLSFFFSFLRMLYGAVFGTRAMAWTHECSAVVEMFARVCIVSCTMYTLQPLMPARSQPSDSFTALFLFFCLRHNEIGTFLCSKHNQICIALAHVHRCERRRCVGSLWVCVCLCLRIDGMQFVVRFFDKNDEWILRMHNS